MSGVTVHGAFRFNDGRVDFVFTEFGDKPVEFSSIQSISQLHQVLEAICNVGVAAGLSAFIRANVTTQQKEAVEHIREVERQVAENMTNLSAQLGEFHDRSKSAIDKLVKSTDG